MFNLFEILNADKVWTERGAAKVVSGDERAVILLSRNYERQTNQPGLLASSTSGVHVTISMSEIRNVLSPWQKRALESENYQALEPRELRSLTEIIAAAKLNPVPSGELLKSGTVFGPNN